MLEGAIIGGVIGLIGGLIGGLIKYMGAKSPASQSDAADLVRFARAENSATAPPTSRRGVVVGGVVIVLILICVRVYVFSRESAERRRLHTLLSEIPTQVNGTTAASASSADSAPTTVADPVIAAPEVSKPEGWVIQNSVEGAYSVAVPPGGEVKPLRIQGPAGQITGHRCEIVPNLRYTYAITYLKYPRSDAELRGGVAARVYAASFLAGFVQSCVQSSGGELVGQSEIHFGTHPGRDFRFSMNGAMGYGRVYLIDGQSYSLVVADCAPSGPTPSPEVRAFLDSFRIDSPMTAQR